MKCNGCRDDKTKESFRANRKLCRNCESRRAVRWAKKNPKAKLESNKRYLSTPLGSEAIRRKTRNFRHKFPQKYAAYITVQSALRNGSIFRKPCEVCGLQNTHAHHDDYSRPLDVRWLCELCHVRIHRAMLAVREKRGEEKL